MLIIFPRGFPHKYSLLRQIGAMLLFKKQHIIALKSAEKISVYICNDFFKYIDAIKNCWFYVRSLRLPLNFTVQKCV